MTGFSEQARRLVGATSFLLGWKPGDFWSATPSELIDALGSGEGKAVVDGPLLARLMAIHPDKE